MIESISSGVTVRPVCRGVRGALCGAAAVVGSVLLCAMLAPASLAQRAGGFVVSPVGRGGGSGGTGTPPAGPLRGRRAPAHRGRHHYGALGYSPYFYPDYETNDEEMAEPPTRVITQASHSAVAPAAKAADSVVMELRGDHWVRLTSMGPIEVNGAAPGASSIVPTSAPPNAVSSRGDNGSGALTAFATAGKTVSELPAAVLIFRDGHQEEAAKYTIVGGVIYIKSDYWSNGSWTRKVNVAELDVPATLRQNQSRGTHFTLPSRPGEVMMRP